MTIEGIDDFRRTSYENWEPTAPGWGRRRGFVEETATMVGEWMLGALGPEPGHTLREEGFGPFRSDGGYEVQGVAFAALAS